jgi:tryptophan-rich sensory protein
MTGMGRNLIGTAAAVVAAAATGSVASSAARSRWYKKLDKPPYQPPPQVFPIAWTALYADIAATSASALTALEGRPREKRRYRVALLSNLALNASWSWVFFRGRRLGLAAVVAALLAASSADLVRRTGSAKRGAGVLLSPYAVWCAFAMVLSAGIWRRNTR